MPGPSGYKIVHRKICPFVKFTVRFHRISLWNDHAWEHLYLFCKMHFRPEILFFPVDPFSVFHCFFLLKGKLCPYAAIIAGLFRKAGLIPPRRKTFTVLKL